MLHLYTAFLAEAFCFGSLISIGKNALRERMNYVEWDEEMEYGVSECMSSSIDTRAHKLLSFSHETNLKIMNKGTQIAREIFRSNETKEVHQIREK